MSDLAVPIHLHFCCVNDSNKDHLHQWKMDYSNFDKFKSIRPPVQEQNATSGPVRQGIHLNWELPPKTLANGTELRHIPNRWMVVRMSPPKEGSTKMKTKSWIIESDTPSGDQMGAPYLVEKKTLEAWNTSGNDYRKKAAEQHMARATETGFAEISLGRVYPAGQWQKTDEGNLFLKAMAPGNEYFLGYIPHSNQVFSFIDPLDDPDSQEAIDKNLPVYYSYLVVGWYSDPSYDPLYSSKPKSYQEIKDFLSEMGMSVVEEISGQKDEPIYQGLTRMVYHGLVYSIKWHDRGYYLNHRYRSGRPGQEPRSVQVALGQNSLDAFQNLIQKQIQSSKSDPKTPASAAELATVFEALAYDKVHLLEEVGGKRKFENFVHRQWFRPSFGGYRWEIKIRDEFSDKPNLAPPTDEELSWLEQVNNRQSEKDQLQTNRRSKQIEAYHLWWKYNHLQNNDIVGMTEEERKSQAQKHGQRLRDLKLEMDRLNDRISRFTLTVPEIKENQATAQDAHEAGIESFVGKNLERHHTLRLVPKTPFYAPVDPAILLCMGDSIPRPGFPDDLKTRRMEWLLRKAYQIENVDIDHGLGRKTGLSHFDLLVSELAGLVVACHEEKNLSDPRWLGDARVYHPLVPKKRPAQPWVPRFFEWEIEFIPSPSLHDQYHFDGRRYTYQGPSKKDRKAHNEPRSNAQVLSGHGMITDHVTDLFDQRLDQLLTDQGQKPAPKEGEEKEAKDVTDIRKNQELKDWNFSALQLNGFHLQLAGLSDRASRLAYNQKINGLPLDVGGFINDETETLPLDDLSVNPSFSGMSQGHYRLRMLKVYDQFGQVFDLIASKESNKVKPVIGPELVPDEKTLKNSSLGPTDGLIAQPPRIAQPARLNFNWVDVSDANSLVDTQHTAQPVAGWLLPNHLDSAISLFDPKGKSLGMVRVHQTDKGKKVVWVRPPHRPELTQLADEARELHQWFLSFDHAKGHEAFTQFMKVVDATLWNIDPFQGDPSMALLMGRPLALVRARLDLELDRAVRNDPRISKTFSGERSPLLDQRFEVQLGDFKLREEGLVGYYPIADKGTWSTFHHMKAIGDNTTDQLKQIQPGNFLQMRFPESMENPDQYQHLWILMDPRAEIHATTNVLPVTTKALPDRFFKQAIQEMELNFEVQNYLSDTSFNLDEMQHPALQFAAPQLFGAKWVWREREAKNGKASLVERPLASEQNDPGNDASNRAFREGFLGLKVDLSD